MPLSRRPAPFGHPEWIFELKYDGFRALTALVDGRLAMWSRNEIDLSGRFPRIAAAMEKLKIGEAVLDGEIVALDEHGAPRFQLLQQWQKRPIAPVVLYVFDLLWSDGRDITRKTVLQRRDRLQQIINAVPGIQVGGYVEERGKDLFQLAKERGLEGIIAKCKTSIYRP